MSDLEYSSDTEPQQEEEEEEGKREAEDEDPLQLALDVLNKKRSLGDDKLARLNQRLEELDKDEEDKKKPQLVPKKKQKKGDYLLNYGPGQYDGAAAVAKLTLLMACRTQKE